MRIDRNEGYPPDSLGAEVLRLCDMADAALPGAGDALLENFHARWKEVATQCPTCTGPIRETVGMVCQTCGTDYAKRRRPDDR